MKFLCKGMMIVLMFLSANSILAQDWGKVSREILEATTFPEAPEADAVILFDIGELEIRQVENDFEVLFKQHVRIKILTESGKEKYSNISIPFGEYEEFKSLKAQTILPNGKKIKIDKDNIFEQYYGNRSQKVFAMPAVETGSVLEYLYTLHSPNDTYKKYSKSEGYIKIYLGPWYFQNEIFTKRSRFTLIVPQKLNYQAFFKNVRDFDPTPQRKEQLVPGLAREINFEFSWDYENIPPLKAEPYVWNVEDYYTAIYFQYLGIERREYMRRKFAQDWQNASQRYAEVFNDYFEEDNGLKDLAARIAPPAINDQEKAKAIYAYVRDDILTDKNWTGGDAKPSEVVKNGAGSADDKNILLFNLLNHANLNPQAIYISTLPHGHFNEELMDLRQFDHLLVRLSIENRDYYLDTQEKFCPFNILPPALLVEKGLLIDKLNGQIVNFPPSKTISMFRVETELRLDSLGNLAGQSNFRIDGYYAMEERQKIAEKGEDDYIADLLKKHFAETEIDSFRITNFEKLNESLFLKTNYRIPKVVNMGDEVVYLAAPLLNSLRTNPFQNPERMLPVEFPYKHSDQEEIRIILPPGYQVNESPLPAIIRQPKMNFGYSCKSNGDTLQVQYQYICQQMTFQPEEYKTLQTFFDEMIEATQTPVVLKRAEEKL